MPAIRGRTITSFGQAFVGLSGASEISVAMLYAKFKGMFRGFFKRMR